MAYRNPALTVDALVARRSLIGRIDVLLIKRGRDPFKDHWAFPGGFVDYGEDPRRAVMRELEEETHLKSLEEPVLVSVRGDPSRDPRQHIVTIAYAIKVDPTSLKELRGDDDASDASWVPLDDVCDKMDLKLAFDHRALGKEFRDWFNKGHSSGNNMGYFVDEQSERIKQDYLKRQQKRQEELERYERELEQRRLERQAQRAALRKVENTSTELLTSITSSTFTESIKTREVINLHDALKWKQIERQNEELKTKRENMKQLLQQRNERLKQIEDERRRRRIPSKPKRFIVQPAEFYGLNFSLSDCSSRDEELQELISRRENELLDEPEKVAQHQAQGQAVINALTDLQALLASPDELQNFVRQKVAQIRRSSIETMQQEKKLDSSINIQQLLVATNLEQKAEHKDDDTEQLIFQPKNKKWTDFLPKSNINYSDVFESSVGQSAGITVFRIEELQPVQQENFESFCLGDCYIVLNTTVTQIDTGFGQKEKLEHEIFQWIGPEASLDKKACAAFFSVGLRNHLGVQTSVHREDGLHESPELHNMLEQHNLRVKHIDSDQATPSGLFVVEQRQYPLLMYRVCSRNGKFGQELDLTLVEPSAKTLESSNVFLLDNGRELFQWNGAQSRLTDKMKCRLLAERVRKRERPNEDVTIFETTEGEEAGHFLRLLGTGTDNDHTSEIYSISASNASSICENFEEAKIFSQQGRNMPSRSLLNSQNCFIIDLFNEVYLWIGRKSILKTRQLAELFLMKSIFPSQEKRPTYTFVSKIMEGVETEVFKMRFSDWDFFLAEDVDYRRVKPTNFVLQRPKIAAEEMKIDIQALNTVASKNEKLSAQEEEAVEELFQRAETLLLNSQCFMFDEQKKKFVKQISWDDKSEHGHFYSAECYVFLCIYRKQVSKVSEDGSRIITADETAREFVTYIWSGRDHAKPSLAELTFTFDFQKTIEKLVEKMSDGQVKLRVVKLDQERENLALLSHLGRKIVVHAGKKGHTANFTRMFHIRMDPRYKVTRAIEVAPMFGSLVSRDAFLVVDRFQKSTYLWYGRGLSKAEEKAAFEISLKIVNPADISMSSSTSSLHSLSSIKIIRERGEPLQFWQLLGPKGCSPSSTEQIASGTGFYYIRPPPKLFRFSTRLGYFKAEDFGLTFSVPDLQTDTICLLDTVPGQGKAYPIYVWVGNQASDVVLKLSKKSVETYLEFQNDGRTLQGSEWDPEFKPDRKTRRLGPDVVIIHQNYETDAFRAYFHGWGSEFSLEPAALQKINLSPQDYEEVRKRFLHDRKKPSNSFLEQQITKL